MKEEELLYCQWCSKPISGEHFGAMFNFDLDEQIKKPEKVFSMWIEFDDILLQAVFPGEDSPDDIKGDDVVMLCCSMDCADNLNEAVAKRPDILGTLLGLRIEGFYLDNEES